MFERTEKLTPLVQLRRAVRDALDPCVVLSRFQRFTRAALWWLLGAAMAIAAIDVRDHRFVEINALAPAVDYAGERFTVYRLRFEWRRIEKSCRLVVYHDSQKWSVSC